MSDDLIDLEEELLENGQGSDNEVEELTAQSVLEVIEKAWLNEKFSPEILPHKTEFVECMLEQIKYMESNICHLPKSDVKVELHKIELERIRYIVTSYLRCRLKKIEQYAFYILEQEQHRSADEHFLSEGETRFAKEYVENLDTHFDSVLKEMPWNWQTLDPANKRIKPNMDSYVFLRANTSVSNVIVRDVFENRDEEVELNENSQHLLPYNSIAENIKDGTVQLI